jgi:2,4-dienoyl-CoA reductase-like NADH-dependent reductase (Old Yellow Enzyme family)
VEGVKMKQRSFLKPYIFKNGLRVENRIFMSPMITGSAFYDGSVTNDEAYYYRQHSGVGMIITGGTNVNTLGKGFEGEDSISEDYYIAGLKKISNAIHSEGSKAILQIYDAGRMTNHKILRGESPRSASSVAALRKNAEIPRTMSVEEIKDFGEATRRAIWAGFDGVEIQGANTYLVQQFFSPHSNRRTDEWGGNLTNRLRFPLAVVDEVVKNVKLYAAPHFIVGYRFSPEEIEEPGIRMADTLKLIDILSDKPIDYLHSSMGSYLRPSLNDKSDKTELNKKILQVINDRLPLLEVGGIVTHDEADDCLRHGATMAGLGVELLREPHWIQKVKTGDEGSIRYNISVSDMDMLNIPRGMQNTLTHAFRFKMHFTDDYNRQLDKAEGIDY